jgi:hypothetical protein
MDKLKMGSGFFDKVIQTAEGELYREIAKRAKEFILEEKKLVSEIKTKL